MIGMRIRRRWSLIEGAVELGRVLAQPAPPDRVIRPSGGHDRPEPRPVTEHPQVRQLVDHHGLEGLWRRQDQAPREAEATLARGAPPARPLVADAEPHWDYFEGSRVATDLTLDR